MITSHTNLLKQLHDYVDEYVLYLDTASEGKIDEANRDLRRLITELEHLQQHSDEPAKVNQLAQDVGAHLDQLRAHTWEQRRQRQVSHEKRTLAQAFQEYLSTEVDYISRAGGGLRRQQTNLLLSDVIEDLKALSLHPTDDQALVLAHNLEIKEEQLRKLQRPWQQAGTTPRG